MKAIVPEPLMRERPLRDRPGVAIEWHLPRPLRVKGALRVAVAAVVLNGFLVMKLREVEWEAGPAWIWLLAFWLFAPILLVLNGLFIWMSYRLLSIKMVVLGDRDLQISSRLRPFARTRLFALEEVDAILPARLFQRYGLAVWGRGALLHTFGGVASRAEERALAERINDWLGDRGSGPSEALRALAFQKDLPPEILPGPLPSGRLRSVETGSVESAWQILGRPWMKRRSPWLVAAWAAVYCGGAGLLIHRVDPAEPSTFFIAVCGIVVALTLVLMLGANWVGAHWDTTVRLSRESLALEHRLGALAWRERLGDVQGMEITADKTAIQATSGEGDLALGLSLDPAERAWLWAELVRARREIAEGRL